MAASRRADLRQPRRRFTSPWQWDCGNPGDDYRFLPTALYEKSPAQSAELQFVCGERGIRTPGPVKINGFQDRRIRPLCHLSKVECYFAPCHVFREMDCKDKYFFLNRKRLGGKSVKNIENGGSGRWIADKNDYLAGCIENTSNTQEY